MIQVARSAVEWTKKTTPRYVTLAMAGWMGLISWGAATKLQDDADAKAYEQCLNRVASRTDLRGALNGIYDYLDPGHNNVNVNALRDRLDDTYEPLYMKDC